MIVPAPKRWLREYRATLLWASILALAGDRAHADVAPPVEIKMNADTPEAASGRVYEGEFLVRVFERGVLEGVELFGDGWTVLTVELPADGTVVNPGLIRVPFTAIPRNADQPIGLTLRFDGRLVTRSYEIGPKFFDRAGKARLSTQIAEASGVVVDGRTVRNVHVEIDGQLGGQPPPVGSEVQSAGGAIPLRAVGRFVYTRRGFDFSNPPDGDTDDPGDVPPVEVGVDSVLVEFVDDDDISSEVIWSGFTDVNGYFDSGVIQWDDCDAVGCDVPDILMRFILNTGVVDVTDNSILEETYTFATPEITDFSGSFHDFGIVTPADTGLHPALHIFNSIVRVERFIRTRTPHDPPHVQVEWPDGTTGAFYQKSSAEIHISTGRQWNETTHTHEFGHHFLNNFSTTVEPDYCNGFCDGVGGGCTFDSNCANDGHCTWCPETDHDAWNEGWPNWLADVVTRSYPDDYQFDDGTPYVSLTTRSQENLGTCCSDNMSYSPLITEGFIGALLRDIEDDTQDDQDGDGIIDSLCLGVEEIFQVVTTLHPTTPVAFINDFRAMFPQYSDELWPTAFNVGGSSFVSGYPADVDPPGVVTVLDSSTHPLGIGGPLPCISVEWEHASDDVTGACTYSYTWSTNPLGDEPDQTADPVDTSTCLQSAAAGFGLGDYYFSIKAMDCSGKWSSQWATFGPFTVTDCNGSGLLDLCDISCSHTGYPGCSLNPTACNIGGCGLSDDCQPNLAPDECDIADGTSEDCNATGVPDECELIFHWEDGGVSWDDSTSWVELQPPVPGSDVCIDVPGAATAVIGHDTFDINILACEETLDIISTTLPRPDVTINEPSWIRGDLKLHGNATTLTVNNRLDIDGTFEWTGSNNSQVAKLTGAGETHVRGGMSFVGIAPLDGHHLVLEPGTMSTSTGWFLCPGSSTVEIKAGAVLDHQGTSFVFSQCWNDQLINDGTIIRSAPTGETWFDIPIINNGLMHVQSGIMTLSRGSTQAGSVIGDPGAVLRIMGGGHDFLPSSSIAAETIEFVNHISGSIFIRGTYDVTGTTSKHSGQTVTFTDQANIINYGTNVSITRGTIKFEAVIGGAVHFDTLTLGLPGSGGTARFNSGDPVDVDNLVFNTGLITGPSPVTVNVHFEWGPSAGFLSPGMITILGTTTVQPGGGVKSLSDTDFHNNGYMTMNGGFQMGGSSQFVNHVGATVDIRVDSGGSVIGGGASIPFINQGTMVKSAGPGTSNVTSPVTNTGTVEIQVGTMQFNKPFVQTSGQIVLNGGEFEAWWPNDSNNPPVQIDGGLVTGAGVIRSNQTLVVNNAGGTFAPGMPAGTLTVAGHYNQSIGGALEIDIEGANQGQFDQLNVSGIATIAGELIVLNEPNFTPAPGAILPVLTANQVVGEFDVVTIPAPYEIRYKEQEVRLIVPLSGDLDENGKVDLHDWNLLMLCFGGSGNAPAPSCPPGVDADLDNDGDVDLDDAAVIVAASMNG